VNSRFARSAIVPWKLVTSEPAPFPNPVTNRLAITAKHLEEEGLLPVYGCFEERIALEEHRGKWRGPRCESLQMGKHVANQDELAEPKERLGMTLLPTAFPEDLDDFGLGPAGATRGNDLGKCPRISQIPVIQKWDAKRLPSD
jgi:hypothetical protein